MSGAQVINGLNERRGKVEKELSTFGQAPKGQKDVFAQCNKFHRAYAAALEVSMIDFTPCQNTGGNSSHSHNVNMSCVRPLVDPPAQNPEVTSRIRKIFNSQEGLTGLVKQLPLEQRFQLLNVKAVCALPCFVHVDCKAHCCGHE